MILEDVEVEQEKISCLFVLFGCFRLCSAGETALLSFLKIILIEALRNGIKTRELQIKFLSQDYDTARVCEFNVY